MLLAGTISEGSDDFEVSSVSYIFLDEYMYSSDSTVIQQLLFISYTTVA